MTSDTFPLFVLTMHGDAARRAPLLTWLKAHGITFELFYGIDGRNGLAPEWHASINRAAAAERLGRKMGDGEFACALSHQEIYRTVLERALPGAVILEDDAVPTDAFVDFLTGRAYHRAPIILLDHSNTRVNRQHKVDLGGDCLAYRIALPPFLTTGYTVSARAAADLRAASLPISFTADWPCDIARLGAVAAWPRLIGHPPEDPAQSHISRDRTSRQRRFGRFAKGDYWVRWWRKRRSVRLPDQMESPPK